MAVLVWVTENTWMACVDAAAAFAPPGSGICLLTVVDPGTAGAVHGAFTGMLGRGQQDPAERVTAAAEAAAAELLDAAQARLGRDAQRIQRHGRAEHEVVSAAAGATLLIAARDSTERGPKSFGKATRFVVDHAPCPVLLVWPGPVSEEGPPGPPHKRHQGPGGPHEHPRPHDHPGPPRSPHGPRGPHGTRGPHDPQGPHDV